MGVVIREINFLWKCADRYTCVAFVKTTVGAWMQICASLNRRKAKKAKQNRLILLEPTANLELLIGAHV